MQKFTFLVFILIGLPVLVVGQEILTYQDGPVEARKNEPHQVFLTVPSPIEPAQLGVTLNYRMSNEGPFRTLIMRPILDTPGMYMTYIPRHPTGTRIQYYFHVLTRDGREISAPNGAPETRTILLLFVGATHPIINILYYVLLGVGMLLGFLVIPKIRGATIPAAARKLWAIVFASSSCLLLSQFPVKTIRAIAREGRLSFDIWIVTLIGLWTIVAVWWFFTQDRNIKDPFTADLKALQRLSWALRAAYIIALLLVLVLWIV